MARWRALEQELVADSRTRGGALEVAGSARRLRHVGADTQHLADAHVVATAVDLGGGIALTTDPEDIGRLAAAYRNVTVVGLP